LPRGNQPPHRRSHRPTEIQKFWNAGMLNFVEEKHFLSMSEAKETFKCFPRRLSCCR
jgi:hypothetical protein